MPLSLVDYPGSGHNAPALTLIAKVEEDPAMEESVMEEVSMKESMEKAGVDRGSSSRSR